MERALVVKDTVTSHVAPYPQPGACSPGKNGQQISVTSSNVKPEFHQNGENMSNHLPLFRKTPKC